MHKKLPALYSFIGGLTGYFILHPAVMMSAAMMAQSHGKHAELTSLMKPSGKVLSIMTILSRAFFHSFSMDMIIWAMAFTASGAVVGFFYGRLVQKNQELFESNRTKEIMFSVISHDLKNSFSGILGFTKLLSFKNNTDQELMENHLSLVRKEAESAYQMMERLLQWVKIKMNKINYHPQKVILKPFIFEILTVFTEQLGRKNLKAENQLKDELIAFTDPGMLEIIFRNIISNAIKFTESDGIIKVSGYRKGNFAVLSISDNGTGMSTEEQAKLFANDQAVRSQKGTEGESGNGLGLQICRELITENKGEIWCESEKDMGTTFYLKLPA